jgi:hypothetical protein
MSPPARDLLDTRLLRFHHPWAGTFIFASVIAFILTLIVTLIITLITAFMFQPLLILTYFLRRLHVGRLQNPRKHDVLISRSTYRHFLSLTVPSLSLFDQVDSLLVSLVAKTSRLAFEFTITSPSRLQADPCCLRVKSAPTRRGRKRFSDLRFPQHRNNHC